MCTMFMDCLVKKVHSFINFLVKKLHIVDELKSRQITDSTKVCIRLFTGWVLFRVLKKGSDPQEEKSDLHKEKRNAQEKTEPTGEGRKKNSRTDNCTGYIRLANRLAFICFKSCVLKSVANSLLDICGLPFTDGTHRYLNSVNTRNDWVTWPNLTRKSAGLAWLIEAKSVTVFQIHGTVHPYKAWPTKPNWTN